MPANNIQPSIEHAPELIGSIQYEIYNPNSGRYEPLQRETYPVLRGMQPALPKGFAPGTLVRYVGNFYRSFFDQIFETADTSDGGAGYYINCYHVLYDGALSDTPWGMPVRDLREVEDGQESGL